MKEKIMNIVSKNDYEKGLNYNTGSIELTKIIHLTDKSKIYKFKVNSQRNENIYNVDLTIKNGEIILTYCSCPQFIEHNKCKHIAACLIKEQDKVFNPYEKNKTQDISKSILENLLKLNEKQKQKLKLELELNFKRNYYGKGLYVKFKVGVDKLYSASSKAKYFFELYNEERNGEYEFGKNFIYNNETQYFDDDDKKIIDFLCNEYYRYREMRYYETDIFITDNKQIELFKLLKNKDYEIIGHGKFNSYEEDFPFDSELINKNDTYTFNLKLDDYIIFLSPYILRKNDKIYLLKKEYRNIIEVFANNDIYSLDFKEEDLALFSETIFKSVKNNIKMNKELENKLIIIDPNTKLYFDFKENKIICNPKFEYKDIIVDYFESTNTIRNREFENNIINELLNYKFIINDKKLELEDINDIGNFLENDIKKLSNKYEVFTTKKLDETTIIKKSNIVSQFSIGQDNIMSYSFDLDNIEINELANIFNNLKEKKKYYKLKNGHILNLEKNKQLSELQNLLEDIDMTTNNIKEFGTIPKYKAIFLDSLKENKYSIIQTNNLFNEFITKFKQFKNIEPYINKKDKNILRDYQLIGVKWLYNIYKCDLGGILADEMGLGKSLQTICFIKSVLKEKPNIRILIVSPTSLIYNWQKEFDKFAKELNYCVIAENKNKRQEILNHLENNIVITTYGLLRQDKELYEQLNFELMIIDEAQNIKNPLAGISKTVKQINAKTKIALTGTPIENSVIELWSIFDFIMPGLFTNLNNFQAKYNIKDINKDNQNILDNLNQQISPFILRRKKIDVAKELPKKQENNIYFDMYPEQKKIYLAELKKTKEEMDKIIEEDGFLKAKFKILQLLTRLRQICIDPSIIFENYKGNSIKIDELINIVKRIVENGHKILIFTSFKTALNIVKKEFDNNNISSYIIDGSVSSKKRMELVDKFNNDDTNVFLITLKAGGTGLNLTSADVVIHLDLWWNPQVENQATDRAHRIGQTKNVEVIKLICKGTIEERIIELQNKKKMLSDTLIEGENRSENLISKLSEKDIEKLLSIE